MDAKDYQSEMIKAINNLFDSIISFFRELSKFEIITHEWRIKYIEKNFPKIQHYRPIRKFISKDRVIDISSLSKVIPSKNEIIKWQEEMEFMMMDN